MNVDPYGCQKTCIFTSLNVCFKVISHHDSLLRLASYKLTGFQKNAFMGFFMKLLCRYKMNGSVSADFNSHMFRLGELQQITEVNQLLLGWDVRQNLSSEQIKGT